MPPENTEMVVPQDPEEAAPSSSSSSSPSSDSNSSLYSLPTPPPSCPSTPSSDTHFEPTSIGVSEKEEPQDPTPQDELAIPLPSSPTATNDVSHPSTVEDFLDQLLDGTKHAVNVDKLVQSARISFCLLESWYRENSYSGDPKVVTLRKKVKAVAKEYLEAIDASVKTAERGISFTNETICLCEYLSECHDAEVNLDIKKIQQGAKSAHADAERTCNKFRRVKQEFTEIAKPLFQAKPDDAIQSRSKDDHCTMRQDPAILQVADLLESAVKDLTALADCVNNYVTWWLRIETDVSGINTSAEGRKFSPFKTYQIQKRCTIVRTDFLEYKTRITVLKDFYPMEAPTTWWRKKWFSTKPNQQH